MYSDTGIYFGRDGIAQAVAANKASNTLITTFVPKFQKDGRRAMNIQQEYTRVVKFDKIDISTSESKPGNYNYVSSNLFFIKTSPIELNKTSSGNPQLISQFLCDGKDFCCKFDLEFNFRREIVLPNSVYYRCVSFL